MTFKRLFRYSSRGRQDMEQDLRDELDFHRTTRIEALMHDGLTREDAEARTEREMGASAARQRAILTHDAATERMSRWKRIASELRHDVIYAGRLLHRSPGFTAVCVLTLAIAIGANTAVFSVVNTVLLKQPAIVAAEDVVRVQPGESRMSWIVYDELSRRNDVFAGMAVMSTQLSQLGEPGTSTRLIGERVSPRYFSLLGVDAALGRTILPHDTRSDIVVLSERTWRLRFAGDPAVVGRRVVLDRKSYEVVGVMPAGFNGLAPPGWVREFWTPVPPPPSTLPTAAAGPMFEVAARLKPGVSAAAATASLRVVLEQIRSDHPNLPEWLPNVRLIPLGGFDSFRGVGALVPVFAFIGLLALIAGFVLLIGCANIAGLLLGRAAARRQELALRTALGAGRGRLVRQLLTESLLLAALGGVGGILVAVWLTGLIPVAVAQVPFPLEFDLKIDWRVLVYTAAISVITALIFGLAPARRAARVDLMTAVREGSGALPRQRLRQTLVVVQVGVCAVLLVWGLLFTRSLGNVSSTDPGFDADDVLLAELSFGSAADAPREQRETQVIELQSNLRQLPIVESAGGAWSVPLSLSARESFPVFLEDDPDESRGRMVVANLLTPGWFDALRIPMVSGRDFDWRDRSGSPEVAIVNRTLADQFWQGRAIGRRLRFTGRRNIKHDVEIVGVAGDSKYWTLGETIEPTVYLPSLQDGVSDGLTLHVRTSSPRDAAKWIAQEMQRLAPEGYVEFKSMRDATAVAVMPARVGAAVTGAFAAVAVLLATLGIYGLIAFAVVQRTREIGIRKAIGASTFDILRTVVGRSVILTGAGLAGGLLLGALGAQAFGGLMVGVSGNDPLTLTAVFALVTTAAFIASLIPALRAARVDPLQALRELR